MLYTKSFRALLATSLLTAAPFAFGDRHFPPPRTSSPPAPATGITPQQAQQMADQLPEDLKLHGVEMLYMLQKIRQEYYLGESVEDLKKLIKSALNGAIKHDPHSQVVTPEELEKMLGGGEASEFIGIGVTLSPHEKGYLVILPHEGTPAYNAGIFAGDIITHVDGVKLIDSKTPTEAINMIRGKENQSVQIIVERNNIELPPINIVRSAVVPKTVRTHMIDDIGYIKISQFRSSRRDTAPQRDADPYRTANEFKAAIKDFEKEPVKPKSLILDLRGNPGGSVEDTTRIADMLLDIDGGIIVNQVGRTPKNSEIHKTKPGQITNLPIAILVDRGSASASELLSIALQDHGRATIIGDEESFGKGTVQALGNATKNWGMKITIAQYFSPLNYAVQWYGVTPDIRSIPLPGSTPPSGPHERDLPMSVKGGLDSVQSPPQRVSKETCAATKDSFAPGELPFGLIDSRTNKPDITLICARDYLNRKTGNLAATFYTANQAYVPPPKVEDDEKARNLKKLWVSPQNRPQ